jgi:lysophospholipase L1-like esterase
MCLKKTFLYAMFGARAVMPLTLLAASDCTFYLKSGDTVVFHGDSVTEQTLDDQWVHLYTVTRPPSMRVHYHASGVGHDQATGGIGGDVDARLARDVYSHHPYVVTVMLGMNDGTY